MISSLLRFRKAGEEFDFQKNKTFSYFDNSILLSYDTIPMFAFYITASTTITGIYPVFEMLKISEKGLRTGVQTIEETFTLTQGWITTALSAKTDRYLVSSIGEHDFEDYDDGAYQLRVTLTEDEIWTSEPFYKLRGEVIPEGITITTDQTSFQTVGINLTFTGDITVDWGDGSVTEDFVSGNELTHSYVSAGSGTYDILIYGDNENITKFIADNSRITGFADFATGTLTDFQIQTNLITGVLDLSLVPISTKFYYYSNASLTGITFASSGNAIITDYQGYSCSTLTSLGLSNVPVGGLFTIASNTSLTSLTFATTGNTTITSFRTQDCNLSALDLSNVPVSTSFFIYSNTSLSSVTFKSSGNGQVTDLRAYGCNFTSLDFTNVTLATKLYVYSNTSLSTLTFAGSGNGTLTDFKAYGCNFTSLSFSNIKVSGIFVMYSNSSLSTLTFSGSGNGALTLFQIFSCAMPDVDFSVFPTSNNVSISQTGNAMTSTEHDDQLINLDAAGWTGGTLGITTGNTARTAASDTAYNNLVANSWNIT